MMTSYASTASLSSRLGDKFASIYGEDTSVAQTDLLESSAEINGFLAKRYQLPISSPQALALLASWELDLAVERAFLRAGGSVIPEKFKDRASAVRQFLKSIARGEMVLEGAEESTTASAGGTALVVGNEPVFEREDLAGF